MPGPIGLRRRVPTICSWCNDSIGVAPSHAQRGPTNYGMCGSCVRAALEKLSLLDRKPRSRTKPRAAKTPRPDMRSLSGAEPALHAP